MLSELVFVFFFNATIRKIIYLKYAGMRGEVFKLRFMQDFLLHF